MNLSEILVSLADTDDVMVVKSIANPVGFGVNEYNFFCVETSTSIFMYPLADVKSVEVKKSKLVAVTQ